MTGTRYETPVQENNDNPPYLVVAMLGMERSISRVVMKRIVRAILERKYPDVCKKDYIEMVVKR